MNIEVESAPPPLGQQVEKVGGIAGKFTGEGVEWHTQRDITDPKAEAEEGVPGLMAGDDDDGEDDHGEDFAKEVVGDATTCDPTDEERKSFIKIGHNLAHAHAANVCGDHEKCYKHLNRAIGHYRKFRAALNAAADS